MKWLWTVYRNSTTSTLQLGTMHAVLTLIKTVPLLANRAGWLVEKIALAVMSKDFIQKHLAKCEPFLEMTLTSEMLERVPGKKKMQWLTAVLLFLFQFIFELCVIFWIPSASGSGITVVEIPLLGSGALRVLGSGIGSFGVEGLCCWLRCLPLARHQPSSLWERVITIDLDVEREELGSLAVGVTLGTAERKTEFIMGFLAPWWEESGCNCRFDMIVECWTFNQWQTWSCLHGYIRPCPKRD